MKLLLVGSTLAIAGLNFPASESSTAAIAQTSPQCSKQELVSIGGRKVWRYQNSNIFFYTSKMAVDADGSPHAYHPNNTGLDDNSNARTRSGKWVGVVTVNGKPVIQTATDPAPGYFVSPTTLVDDKKTDTDPTKYVDSEKIPYIVLPPMLQGGNPPDGLRGARLGDLAVVYYKGKLVNAIFADSGNSDEVGEASIAVAKALGIKDSPRSGGASSGVTYVVFPRSGMGNGKLRTLEEINTEAQKQFKAWGGMARLNACLK
ncbi:MAG: glycoside hydrolase family 75 protein [Scytolyngbya sp. HA4215-MV1]|nr:glycoside hydrolase family 75 protein [Scytolyngbya sp. HA4215-MV1]